jgi:hypothetical protein
MASFSQISAKVVFRTDTGETNDGKAVYRDVTLGNLSGTLTAGALGEVAVSVSALLRYPTDRVTLTRSELVVL